MIPLLRWLRCAAPLLLTLLSAPLFAQQLGQGAAEALRLELTALPQDTQRVKTLAALSAVLVRSDTAEAREQAMAALSLANELAYPLGKALATQCLGELAHQSGDHELALEQYAQALRVLDQHGRPSAIAAIQMAIGKVHKDQGHFPEALAQYLTAFEHYQLVGDTAGLAACQNTIGTFYRKRGELKKAEEHYRNNLQLLQGTTNNRALAFSYINLGNLNARQGNFEQAIGFYEAAIPLYQQAGDVKGRARALNNLGNVHYELRQNELAIQYYTESLELKKELGNRLGVANSYNNLGSVYDDNGAYETARTYYQLAYEIGRELEAATLQQAVLENLSWTSQRLNDYQTALSYTKLADSIALQLAEEELAQQLSDVQVKYETEKVGRENDALRLETERQSEEVAQKTRERNSLLLIAALVLALAIATLLAARQTRKANRALAGQKAEAEQREQEKAVLLRELHHRVKNNLQVVSSLLSLQSHRLKDQEAKDAVKEGQNRVEAMSLIHRNLYQTDELTHIDMPEYINRLTGQVMQSYGYRDHEVNVVADLDPVRMEVDRAIPLGLVLNEMVSNAFKHAFATVEQPELRIALKQAEAGAVLVAVHDNGSGMPPEAMEGSGGSFGMQLIRSLTKQLRGTLTLKTDSGTRFELSIPSASNELP